MYMVVLLLHLYLTEKIHRMMISLGITLLKYIYTRFANRPPYNPALSSRDNLLREKKAKGSTMLTAD